MRSRFSQFLAKAACLSLLLAAFGAAAPAKAATEDYSLIYPTPEQLFGPRIYGKGEPPNKIIMLLAAGGFDTDREIYQALYQPLMNLVSTGVVLLDIRVTGQHQLSFPIYLAAQCVAPVGMLKFLHDVYAQERALLFDTTIDLDTALLQLAQRDPIFRPQGLTAEQFERRMRWCMAQRNAGIIAEEAQRFQTIYDFDIKWGGVSGIAVIVNGKVHEGALFPQKIQQELK